MTDVAARLRAGVAQALGRPPGAAEESQLDKYLNLLTKWQKTQRLVGSSDADWIVDNVIVDSLLFARLLPSDVSAICDLGSGAGVPGIPLRVMMPAVDMTLIEARERRASFLSTVVRELGLTRCRVINRRFEDAAEDLAGTFDAVVMRCAGSPAQLATPVSRLLRPGGIIVASGPPRATPVTVGEWREVDGPRGRRRFWIYRVASDFS